MQLTSRRTVLGLASAAVVITLTGATTWALAGTTTSGASAAPPVHLIVGYKNGGDTGRSIQLMSAMGARRTAAGAGAQALDALQATTVQVPATSSASLIASLKSDPNVAYVEVDHVRKVAEVAPNDPVYTENLQPELKEVNLPAAWETTTGSAVKIAVIDTGVSIKGDLVGAVGGGYDFVNNDSTATDDYGHGTTVASLIAARGNNGQGMAGVCWQCQIQPVKVLDSSGNGYDSTIAKGITYAVQNGAKIINMSLGGPEYSQVLADAVAYANVNGVLVVAAAGNSNTSAKSYPAAFGDVLAVGATNRCPNFDTDPTCTAGTTDRAPFSNYNSATSKYVDVAAPGIVAGMDNNGNYNTGEAGTSFSAPIVSGIAGLLKTVKPSYSGWSLGNAIQASSTPIGSWVYSGKVNAAKSFTIATDVTAPTSTGINYASYAKTRGTLTVTPLKIADNWSGIRVVQLWVDGVFKGYAKASPWGVKWNSAGRNGNVKLQLRIYDKASNVKVLDRTVVADNTAPAVKVTKAPKNKSKVKGTVKVYYTGSDKYGISRYQLLVNGKVVQTHSTTKVAFSFVASKYPKTNIRVQVRAYDVAGNSRITTALVYHR
jgi:subtilisin family serine protease/archaellum component FlaF (FlaF/FlaG flagellin family)